MFKKLKDKIAEEVKQSPLRLPTSVQQHLSQYSPFTRETHNGDNTDTQIQLSEQNTKRNKNASENRIQETLVDIAEDSGEAGHNQFSIADGDSRSTSPNATKDELFQAVNLNEPKRDVITSTPQPSNHGRLSRQSSLSSVFSDVSFLVGASESTYHPYHFQSDLESNVSEFDESASQSSQSTADRVSKEHIYNAYQKMRMRYHKYKGRYADLARHYKELEREREKVKHVLTETQDRSLRRISELKEQCVLEQQAKAHLEENLRSDLEEKDNLIAVLQTKVKLLASPSSVLEGVLVDLCNSDSKTQNEANDKIKDEEEKSLSSAESEEVVLLKEKLQRFESLLIKCKENIKKQNDRNNELQAENAMLKQNDAQKLEDINSLKKSHCDELALLTESLNMARKEIETLRHQEQEAALAAAETKQKVHAELLKQEEEMVRLRVEREQLINKMTLAETEMKTVKEEMTKQLQEAESVLELEKQKLLKELSRGKTEALKLMDEDMDNRLEDLRKEKDAQWEATLQKKLSEEAENYSRTLRQSEERFRLRLAEIQEEKALALEEKELHCLSLIAREQNNQQGLQMEIADLKREIETKEKLNEKNKEEWLEERRSWVQQIEENRQRHLEEMELTTAKHQQLIEEIEKRHQNAIDLIVLELRQKHTKEIETIQQQHGELLQAANEDIESSAKNQIEQLRILLQNKETELSVRSTTIQDLNEQLKRKDDCMKDLNKEVANLEERLASMDSIKQELKEALEKANLLSQLQLELEKAKEELNTMSSCLSQLENDNSSLKQSSAEDRAEVNLLQEKLEKSNEECQLIKGQIEIFNSELNKRNQHLLSLSTVDGQLPSLKESLDQKDTIASDLLAKIKLISDSANDRNSELEKAVERLSDQLQTALTDLQTLKSTLELKTEQLEEGRSSWLDCESRLKLIITEKENELAAKQAEVNTLEQTMNGKMSKISALTNEVAELECYKTEMMQKLATTESDMTTIQHSLMEKDGRLFELTREKEELSRQLDEVRLSEQQALALNKDLNNLQSEIDLLKQTLNSKDQLIADLEKAQCHWNVCENQLKSEVDDKTHLLGVQLSELENLQRLLENKEGQINGLLLEIESVKKVCGDTSALQSALGTSNDRVSELEQAQAVLFDEKCKLLATINERDESINAHKEEVKSMLETLEAKERLVTELQEEILQGDRQVAIKKSEWEQKFQELCNSLTVAEEALKLLQESSGAKDERILKFEEEQNRWNSEHLRLKTVIEDSQRDLETKDSEVKSLKDLCSRGEQQISELQMELQRTTELLNAQDSELKQTIQNLKESLVMAETEIRNLKTNLDANDSLLSELEESRRVILENDSKVLAIVQDKDRLIDEKESKIQEQQSTLDEKILQIANLQGLLDETNSRLNTVQSESEQKLTDLSKLLDAKQSQLETTLSSLHENQDAICRLKEDVEQMQTLIEQNKQKLVTTEMQLKAVTESLNEKEDEIAELKAAHVSLEDATKERARLLEEKASELEVVQRTVNENMVQTTELQAALSAATEQLEKQTCELQKCESSIMKKEDEIKRLGSNLEETCRNFTLKIAEYDALNHSLNVKESVIVDLQSEIERNGQMLSETRILLEDQQQRLNLLEQTLKEKDDLTERYKNQFESAQSELRDKLVELNHMQSEVERSEQNLRQQLTEKDEMIRGIEQDRESEKKRYDELAASFTSIEPLKNTLQHRENELDEAKSHIKELKEEIRSLHDKVNQIETEKDHLVADSIKLEEKWKLKENEGKSIEDMETRIKNLTAEVNTLTEDKSRLETLCKRFKVQLTDTRKLLSSMKSPETSTTKETPSPAMEEPDHVKSIQSLSSTQPMVQKSQETNTEDTINRQLSALQTELSLARQQHKAEVAELTRLVELGKAPTQESSCTSNGNSNNFHGSLEEATELEYLRNILFEYMMGRQPATLAKVVAAIVKFTPEQTRKIVEREEQRQSLLGHLGFA